LFLSLCALFLFIFSVLVKKPSPVDLDVAVNFLLSHTSDEGRHAELIIEQDSSRRRGEERGGLGHSLRDRWMGRGGFHLLATPFSELDANNLYFWRCVGNQAIIIVMQYA
jgi:hypothetical protein